LLEICLLSIFGNFFSKLSLNLPWFADIYYFNSWFLMLGTLIAMVWSFRTSDSKDWLEEETPLLEEE
jgi:hypothetical protein